MAARRSGLKIALAALAVALMGLVPYPRAFTTTMRQACIHQRAREYGAALAAYERAAHLSPTSPLPWLRAGDILLRQHRWLQAAASFQEAERLGGAETALLGLGESSAGHGDWATALRTWLQAWVLAPDDARIHVALGRGNIAQHRFRQALYHLVYALNSGPSPAEAASARALMGRLLVSGDPMQAMTLFRQAGDEDMTVVLSSILAEPDPGRRELLLGAAFLQRDELALARQHFESAVARAPWDAEPHAYLAHTLDRLGATFTGRKLLERALALDPSLALAYYFLGVHQREAGNGEAARAALWEALLRDPDNAALYVEMAEAFVSSGEYSKAEEWYVEAVNLAPNNLDFHLALVHFYLDHLYGVEEKGLSAARSAMALAPRDPRTHDLLGWAYYLAGSPMEGEQFLVQALILDPDLASAHYHLGSLYARSGLHESASEHLQRCIDLDTEGYYRMRAEAILGD